MGENKRRISFAFDRHKRMMLMDDRIYFWVAISVSACCSLSGVSRLFVCGLVTRRSQLASNTRSAAPNRKPRQLPLCFHSERTCVASLSDSNCCCLAFGFTSNVHWLLNITQFDFCFCFVRTFSSECLAVNLFRYAPADVSINMLSMSFDWISTKSTTRVNTVNARRLH